MSVAQHVRHLWLKGRHGSDQSRFKRGAYAVVKTSHMSACLSPSNYIPEAHAPMLKGHGTGGVLEVSLAEGWCCPIRDSRIGIESRF